MKSRHNFKIQNKCLNCDNRNESFFCSLPETDLKVFEPLRKTRIYPKGARLFGEGENSSGIYLLCHGQVKLSTCSKDGRVIILHIAKPGEILGLSSSISNSINLATAEALEECEVKYIRNRDFLHFLEQNTEACLNAVRQLSRNYNAACLQICTLGLSTSIADKLATLLLEWCKTGVENSDGIHLKIHYTHEELAQMIGSSRESVTRQLKIFRDCQLITRQGSEIIIPDRKKLAESIGFNPHPTQNPGAVRWDRRIV